MITKSKTTATIIATTTTIITKYNWFEIKLIKTSFFQRDIRKIKIAI